MNNETHISPEKRQEIESKLDDIRLQAEKLTPGNVAHHRATIIMIADYLKSLLNN